MDKQKDFKGRTYRLFMKRGVSYATTILLGIITLIFGILWAIPINISISNSITISSKLSFYYFLALTLIFLILTYLANNKRKR